MKTIIVAIDFSRCSLQALKYSIMVANKISADIQMVNVDSGAGSEVAYNEAFGNGHKGIVKAFENIIDNHKDDLKKGEMRFKIRTGKVYREVTNQAKYSDAYLTIAGTHGISGFEEFWIGSNAYRIVSYSTIPVITLRTSFQPGDTIEKIVLPIDSSIETRQKVPFTCKIAKQFGSEIHVLGLYSSNVREIQDTVDNYCDQTAKFVKEEGLDYEVKRLNADNITKTAITYAEDVKAGLISIMTEQETTTSNIFLGAYAQQMINHSPIPVLSIHPRELLRVQSR